MLRFRAGAVAGRLFFRRLQFIAQVGFGRSLGDRERRIMTGRGVVSRVFRIALAIPFVAVRVKLICGVAQRRGILVIVTFVVGIG